MKNISNLSIHIMTVTNDENGRRQIAELRKSIRETKRPFRVVFYGRGHRFGQGRLRQNPKFVQGGNERFWLNTNRYQSALPLDKAQRLAVYLKSK